MSIVYFSYLPPCLGCLLRSANRAGEDTASVYFIISQLAYSIFHTRFWSESMWYQAAYQLAILQDSKRLTNYFPPTLSSVCNGHGLLTFKNTGDDVVNVSWVWRANMKREDIQPGDEKCFPFQDNTLFFRSGDGHPYAYTQVH